MFRIRFLNFFDHPVACCDCLNTLYSLENWSPIFEITQRSPPYLQTGTPQLRSRKYSPLKHEAERRIFSVLRSRAPHFSRITKWSAAFFRITKQSAAFFTYYEAESTFRSEFCTGTPHVLRLR